MPLIGYFLRIYALEVELLILKAVSLLKNVSVLYLI